MNKIKRLYILSFILILTVILLSGCWNYREIDELAIVSGVAIDKGSGDNKYLLTAEIVDLEGMGKENKIKSRLLEIEGKTIFDAIRNMIKISGKRLYWPHVDIIIISQGLAREGIFPIIDFINRDTELRFSMHILISKEKTAGELLSKQSITTDLRAINMKQIIEAEKGSLAKTPYVDVRNLINDLSGEGISAVLPTVKVVTIQGEETIEVAGIAVFQQDKFIGFLDEEDTKYFLFIRNHIKAGLFTLDKSTNINGVTLEIFKNKTKIQPIILDGKSLIKIDLETEMAFAETGTSSNLIDERSREVLVSAAEKALRDRLINVIKKVQKQYKVDIFGFGTAIKRNYPSFWKENKNNWNKMFNDLDVRVKTKIKLRGSGISFRPVYIGD